MEDTVNLSFLQVSVWFHQASRGVGVSNSLRWISFVFQLCYFLVQYSFFASLTYLYLLLMAVVHSTLYLLKHRFLFWLSLVHMAQRCGRLRTVDHFI